MPGASFSQPSSEQQTLLDRSLLAQAYDPVIAVNSTAIGTGVLNLVRLRLPVDATITNILVWVITAGGTLTSSQNFAALYDSAGTRVALTADQATAWGSTGAKTMALTSTYAARAGLYYVGLLSNGTTGPAFARSAGVAIGNIGQSAPFRFSTSGSGQTSTPSSVTLGSVSSATVPYWAGLS